MSDETKQARPALRLAIGRAPGACPDDCWYCSGEACRKCGAGCWDLSERACTHDVAERHQPNPPIFVGVDYGSKDDTKFVAASRDERGVIHVIGCEDSMRAAARLFSAYAGRPQTAVLASGIHSHVFTPPNLDPPQLCIDARTAADWMMIGDDLAAMVRRAIHLARRRRKRARLRARGFVPSGRPHKRRRSRRGV